MSLIWIIVTVIALYGIIAIAGRWLTHAFATISAIFYTPIIESIRLRRDGNRRIANWLIGSFTFAMVMLIVLIALLIVIPQ